MEKYKCFIFAAKMPSGDPNFVPSCIHPFTTAYPISLTKTKTFDKV